MPERLTERVASPARLAALRRLGMLDAPADPRFQRITRLATDLLGVPVSLISLVDIDRQFFAGQTGLPEPWASMRQTPLSHSFCQHVVADQSSLVVTDARLDPRLRENLAIDDLGVVAYCGVPLTTQEGDTLGSFCVIDGEPREWTEAEIAIVEDLAGLVQTELALAELETARATGNDGAQYVAAIAHDVRGMLTAISGGANTLARAETMTDDQRRALAGIIERQSLAMRELVTILLDTTTLHDGGLPIGLVDVDVSELVTDVVASYQLAGSSRVRGAVGDGQRCQADPVHLRRCINNLVDNALKHAGTHAAVEVTTRTEGDEVVIAVVDDGVGIDAERLAIVFNRAQQGDRPADGYGLGLHVVRRLATAMGGSVEVDSVRHAGSTFTLRFPAA